MKRIIDSTYIVLFVIVLSACDKELPPSNTTVAEVFTPTSQVLEDTITLPGTNTPSVMFSSDLLDLCFSYPQGFTQIPNTETVEVMGPELPETDLRGIFWLERSDAYDRTADVIADQDLSNATGIEIDRWTVTLDGEEAVVLDGMPGQDLQRRVYVVHQQTLYILGFMPTRSENQAASEQMESLYAAIINSWRWSSCSTGE